MLAYRLLLKSGRWDVDAFFAAIPDRKWAELKIAMVLNDSRDQWLAAVARGWNKPYEPPQFEGEPKRKNVRRRLDGSEY